MPTYSYNVEIDGRKSTEPLVLSAPVSSEHQLEDLARRFYGVPAHPGGSFKSDFKQTVVQGGDEEPAAQGEAAPARDWSLQGLKPDLSALPPALKAGVEMAKRSALPVAGGAAGMAAGTAAGGPGVGMILGAAGAAAGETANQALGWSPPSPEQVGLAAAAQVTGPFVGAGAREAAKFIAKRLPGAAGAQHELAAQSLETLTSGVARGQASPLYENLAANLTTIRQQGLPMPKVAMTNTADAIKELWKKELQLPKLGPLREKEIQSLVGGVWNDMLGSSTAQNPQLPLDRFVALMPRVRQRISETMPTRGTQQYAVLHGAYKKLESALLKDMDAAIQQGSQPVTTQAGLVPVGQAGAAGSATVTGGPSGARQYLAMHLGVLKEAGRLHRMESAADALQEFTMDKAMKIRAQGDTIQVMPGKILEKLRTDEYMAESLGTELAPIVETVEKLSKLPALSPGRAQQYGSGRVIERSAILYGLGKATGVGGENMVALGNGVAWAIGKGLSTAPGRKFLLNLFGDSTTLNYPKVAALLQWARANNAGKFPWEGQPEPAPAAAEPVEETP